MRYMIIFLLLTGCSYDWVTDKPMTADVQRQFGMDDFECRKATTTYFPGSTSVMVSQDYTRPDGNKSGAASGFVNGAGAFAAVEAQRPKTVFNGAMYISCMKSRGYRRE